MIASLTMGYHSSVVARGWSSKAAMINMLQEDAASEPARIAQLKAEGEKVIARRAKIAEAMTAALENPTAFTEEVATAAAVGEAVLPASRFDALKAEGEQVVARRAEIADAMAAARNAVADDVSTIVEEDTSMALPENDAKSMVVLEKTLEQQVADLAALAAYRIPRNAEKLAYKAKLYATMAKVYASDVEEEARARAADPSRPSSAPPLVKTGAEAKLAAKAALEKSNEAAKVALEKSNQAVADALEQARRTYQAEAENGFPSVAPVVQAFSGASERLQQITKDLSPGALRLGETVQAAPRPAKVDETKAAAVVTAGTDQPDATVDELVELAQPVDVASAGVATAEVATADAAAAGAAAAAAAAAARIAELKADGERTILRRVEIAKALDEYMAADVKGDVETPPAEPGAASEASEVLEALEASGASQAERLAQLRAECEQAISRRADVAEKMVRMLEEAVVPAARIAALKAEGDLVVARRAEMAEAMATARAAALEEAAAAQAVRIGALKAEGDLVVARRAEMAEAMATARAVALEEAPPQAVRIGALKAEGELVVARRAEIAGAVAAALEQATAFAEEAATAAIMEVAATAAVVEEEEETVTAAVVEEEKKEEEAATAAVVEEEEEEKEEEAASAAVVEVAAAMAAVVEEEEEVVVGVVTPTLDIFESFDTDQSGDLDLDELKEAAMAAGLPADDEAIRETMAALDTNRDGVVSLEEFKAAPRAVSWWEKNDF